MSWSCSIPAKTFLAGEYLALHDGPALVFLSQPYFELTAEKGHGELVGIHQDSPAGLFIKKHHNYFKNLKLEFKDPYAGRGGFGASTAQFLGCYALWLYKESHLHDMEKPLDLKHLLDSYYEVAWQGQGQRPSGADLVGQVKGSFTFFEKRSGLISLNNWPFPELEFILFHTGNKIATHEHLQGLTDFNSKGLEKSFQIIRESFEAKNKDLFIEGINAYAKSLQELQFTCEPTLRLLKSLQQVSGVRAAKGCGALGADVLFVVTEKGQTTELKKYCAQNGLVEVASTQQIAQGIHFQGNL